MKVIINYITSSNPARATKKNSGKLIIAAINVLPKNKILLGRSLEIARADKHFLMTSSKMTGTTVRNFKELKSVSHKNEPRSALVPEPTDKNSYKNLICVL